jgi:hypothetical protein
MDQAKRRYTYVRLRRGKTIQIRNIRNSKLAKVIVEYTSYPSALKVNSKLRPSNTNRPMPFPLSIPPQQIQTRIALPSSIHKGVPYLKLNSQHRARPENLQSCKFSLFTCNQHHISHYTILIPLPSSIKFRASKG